MLKQWGIERYKNFSRAMTGLTSGLDAQTAGPNADLYGLTGRVKLSAWLFISLDPVPGAAITSVSSSRNRKAVENPNPFTVGAPNVDTRSTGRSFQVMPQSAVDKIPSGPKLVNMTISFSKLVLLHPPLTSHKYQALFS